MLSLTTLINRKIGSPKLYSVTSVPLAIIRNCFAGFRWALGNGKKIWLLLAAGLMLTTEVRADFTTVRVRLQSGQLVPIMDLPWFKFQVHIYESQWKDRAATADWVVLSTPLECPTSSSFRLFWGRPIPDAEVTGLINRCNERQERNLAGMPQNVIARCKCSPVLRTDLNAAVSDGAVWRSHNDAILLSDEIRIRAMLSDSERRETPIIFTLAGKQSGIYDYSGNRVCQYKTQTSVATSGALAMARSLIENKDKPISIECIGGRRASLDMSELSIGLLERKLTGEVRFLFESGEYYIIRFP